MTPPTHPSTAPRVTVTLAGAVELGDLDPSPISAADAPWLVLALIILIMLYHLDRSRS